jgi:EAL domain-containing protein (putative c-di-GMP-specific phosphodiesterase class I)
MIPRDGYDPSVLIKKADLAMYASKRDGKNRFTFYQDAMWNLSNQTFELESLMRQASLDEFTAFYQPIVDAVSRRIVGFEALVRWVQPNGRIISPGEFLELAEETGLIVDIGRHMLQQACRQLVSWRDAGYGDFYVAVNVADRQFSSLSMLDDVRRALSDSGLPATALCLELTEGVLMHQHANASMLIRQLKEMGCLLSVDDFGTGYSSLSHLQKIPLDTLKIDQSFVRKLPANANDAKICEMIISLSKSLGFNVVAEGVELDEQADFLQAIGATHLQGYLYGRPMMAEDVESLLVTPESTA